MKRFLLKLLLLFILMLGIDIIAGNTSLFLSEKAKGGNTWRNNYICSKTTEDILIFGSSRAFHHYNPEIIERELGMTCYNCGQDGNGIILNYGRYKLISSRYKPKLIIYDITPTFDILAKDDNHKYLSWLKPFYDCQDIKDVFASVDSTEAIKMKSQLYRYNSSFLMLLSDAIAPQKSKGINGYRPEYGKLDRMKINSNAQPSYPIDSLKVYYLKRFVESLDDTVPVVLVYSPIWYGRKADEGLSIIKQLCDLKGIPFFDFSNDDEFVHNDALFIDGSHLNNNGADLFSKKISKRLFRIGQ